MELCAFRPGHHSGADVAWESEGEPGPAAGYLVTDQPGGNRVATSSVRAAVIDSEPERVAPAAPLCVFSSYAAVVMEQPELVAVSGRRVRIAKHFQPLRRLHSVGEEIRDAVLFL